MPMASSFSCSFLLHTLSSATAASAASSSGKIARTTCLSAMVRPPSVHAPDRRQLILAVKHGLLGLIHPQDRTEWTGRGGQPVGHPVVRRSFVLQVDGHGPVRGGLESGRPVTDRVAVDGIRD